MRPLAEVLQEIVRELGLQEALALQMLRRRWQELLGSPMAEHLWPVALKEGVLLVGAAEPLWHQEMRFQEGELLRRLRPFGVKALRPTAQAPRKAPPRKAPPPPKKELSPKVAARAEEMLKEVQEPELRDILRPLLQKALQQEDRA